MIYLDNASTTKQKPQEVVDACVNALVNMGNGGRGASKESLDAQRMIYQTRVKIAEMIGAKNPSSIAFTSNATHSLNLAIGQLIKPEYEVITTVLEHNSVLRPLYKVYEEHRDKNSVCQGEETILCDKIIFVGKLQTQDVGKQKNYIQVGVHEIEQAITENTKAIIITHASNITGDIVDIKSIGTLAKKYKLLFLVDASQTMGVVPIDVQEMNIDILCFTGHKALMGPQGTGGIYVREGLNIGATFSGGTGMDTYHVKHPTSMPEVLEAGTLNSHGIAGLYAALNYIQQEGQMNIWSYERKLMEQFYHGIKEIESVKIYGDFSRLDRCAIVSINIGEYDSGQVALELEEIYEITTRAGGHCAPKMHEALGTINQGVVRFSFSYHNTEEEIALAIKAVKELAVQ